MNIYLLTQNENNGYDTYDAIIVVAATVQNASQIHPSGYIWKDTSWYDGLVPTQYDYTWTTPDNVSVKLLGIAMLDLEPGVILTSFNAG